MKIIYSAASPKAGQTEHVSQQVGQTLCAAGFASAVPLPPRGSKGWLEAIAEIDKMRTAPSQYDTVPPNATGTEWSASILGSGQVRVIKKVDGTVWWFDGPPKECPANIREQFLQLAAINPGANAAALEEAKRKQVDYEASVQFAKRY